jgi:exosortase
LQIVVVVALVLFVYWVPINRDMVWRWANDGNWSHGWLVPAFSLYFLLTRRDELFRIRPRPNYLGALVLAASLLLYFLSVWHLRMHYPQALSIVGVVFGLALLFGGMRTMRIAWFPILFLLFAIPLPERYYVLLTMPLRAWASSAAAVIMPLVQPGLYTEAQTVVIDYVMPGRPPGTLNIEEACSGLRLMMSFFALGVAMAYLGARPTWQRVLMVVSCIPIAVLCNTVRVTVTGLLQINGHEDLARGTAHQVLGIGMLLLAFGFYFLLGYVLSHLFVEEADDGDAEAVGGTAS